LPIKNNYATPATLGKDRLAGAVAAKFFFPNEHCLVIDCGTSTTYNFVTDKGEFLGGSISLGMAMRFKALPQFTAKLPLIEKGNIDGLIGNDTEMAIRTGVQLGAVHEMDGFVEAYVQRFGKIRTLLTGGETDYFVKHLKNKIFALENLVLTGLNEILIFNTDHK
jgi:type III pantothenate kinase